MFKKFLSKSLAMLLAVLTAVSCTGLPVFALDFESSEPDDSDGVAATESQSKLEKIRELLSANTYTDYTLLHGGAVPGTDDVTIDAASYNEEKTTAKVIVDKYLGEDAVLIPETGDVTWDFEVNATGRYHIAITYAPIVTYDADGNGTIDEKDLRGNGAVAERSLLLDDTYPFSQSRYIEMPRIWSEQAQGETNERGFVLDNDGNEIKPNKVEDPEWRTINASDSTGYITEPFLYYIEAGHHTLTLGEVQEVVAIRSIRLYYDGSLLSYAEYLKENDGKPAVSAAETVKIEAEQPYRTSSNIIYPTYDRSSAATSPHSAYNIYLNTIGGTKWQTVGQWIDWTVTVPEDGYYHITPRFNQSFAEGMYVTRQIAIDGVVPFREAEALRFKYDDDWQLKPLTDGVEENGQERALKFYLTKGTHHLEMQVTLGTMADVLTEVEQSLAKINEYYLQILMLTGSDPDEYRDYGFTRLIPETIKGLDSEAKRLYAISAKLEEINGTKGSDSITLDNVALLLERMASDEDLIAPSFSKLKDYIGSLGTWIMTARNQPLEFDYILLYPADAANGDDAAFLKKEGYRGEASFWSATGYEFQQFFMSWVSDYSSYGVRTTSGDDFARIEVWTTSGRDQSTIVRSLISDSFTQQYNVAVDLKLVAVGSLLPATLSGSGPDVNLALASATVINYAIRSAVIPISPSGYVDQEGDSEEVKAHNAKCREIFADYDNVMTWFADAATIPMQLYGVAYGLPQTEHFSMLFYRSDILVKLGLDIPETWDDVYNMLPTLQTNNLQFGYHESLAGLLILLYQRGERLYKDARADDPDGTTYGMQINLDSNTSLETFKDLCEMYTMYGFPYSYNFVNRFRTGEMPIGVAQYTIYSQLTIFAPELRGLWGFTLLPGTPEKDENGNDVLDENGDRVINHTADTTITGVVMMRGCEEIEAAWNFMKWWCSADIQANYGQEYYALLGASGQYATANKDALFSMSWTADERAELLNQFENHLQATPEMPGGYIVTRYVEFAFLRAYNKDEDPVEAMLSYIDTINAELSRKRSEFGLVTLEEYEASHDA